MEVNIVILSENLVLFDRLLYVCRIYFIGIIFYYGENVPSLFYYFSLSVPLDLFYRAGSVPPDVKRNLYSQLKFPPIKKV